MKKLLTVLLCAVLSISVTACGAKNNSTEKPKTQQTQTDSNSQSKSDSDKKDVDNKTSNEEQKSTDVVESDDKENNSEATEPSSDLGKMVTEFNDPDISPERKEELRQQLEEILAQAEAASEK